MKNGRYIAYYRVSTKRQGRSGLGLEAQKTAVADYLNDGHWTLVAEVTEIETGTSKRKRPKLMEAIRLCRVYGATLLIAKLDRLSRNVAFTTGLMESGIEFLACDCPEANRLTIQTLAVIAEYEAGMISTRTKAALQAARARGVRLGGYSDNIAAVAPKGNKASAAVRAAAADKRAADLLPTIQDIQAKGAVSLRDIAAKLNEDKVPTPRKKGEWSAVQVQRVMNRNHA